MLAEIKSAIQTVYKPAPKWHSAGGVLLAGRSPELRRYVYIIKPSNNYGPWSLPKGRIDNGESLYTAALREVREETGIVARIIPHTYLGEYEGRYSKTHYVIMTFERREGMPDRETEEVRVVTVARAIRLFEAVGNYRDACVLYRARDLIESGD